VTPPGIAPAGQTVAGGKQSRPSPDNEAKRDPAIVAVVAAEDEDEDEDGDNAASPGIVLRTDYSTGSDDAWAIFCRALRDAERDFLADQEPHSTRDDAEMDVDVDVEAPASQPGASHTTESNNAEEKEGSSDDEGDGNGNGNSNSNEELLLFSFISNPTQLNNISNLRALRLLFDLSVRAAPAPTPTPTPAPPQHQHRLTNLRGLQETYDARGRTLWIFDSRSRADGCARLVSEAGDVASSVPPPAPFLLPPF